MRDDAVSEAGTGAGAAPNTGGAIFHGRLDGCGPAGQLGGTSEQAAAAVQSGPQDGPLVHAAGCTVPPPAGRINMRRTAEPQSHGKYANNASVSRQRKL